MAASTGVTIDLRCRLQAVLDGDRDSGWGRSALNRRLHRNCCRMSVAAGSLPALDEEGRTRRVSRRIDDFAFSRLDPGSDPYASSRLAVIPAKSTALDIGLRLHD